VADRQTSRFRLPWPRAAQPAVGRDGAAATAGWRATLRSRLGICAALCVVWVASIEARLVYLQVVAHASLMVKANRQQLRDIKIPGKRGEIVDRQGRILAVSVDVDTIAADPTAIGDPEQVATEVCRSLDACDERQRRAMAERLVEKLASNGQFAYLARLISPEEARRVRALSLPGLLFMRESARYYPNREMAAHVLGYVGVDNQGLAGLESAYDARIRGREGRILVQADARKRALFSREERPPTTGDALELTIDQHLQYIAERELRIGVEENHAAGGTAIIMQPQTGDILALANWPTFNPNAFLLADPDVRRNRATQELYEPGSTFKVVTASAALDEHVIVPDDLVDCSPGFITFPGRPPIRDVHRYGLLPFTDVIVKSSNVGAIKVGMRVGPERLGRYISRFGFGQVLAPDFRGENPGLVWNPARLDPSALASVSMGYQIGVTPIQMASAVSSVANGGVLVEPRVVRAFIRNGRRDAVAPKDLRHTITPETANTLTGIMEEVVARGTGTAAQLEGYTVAGKTGTAAKVVNGHYSRSEYNASFVGFVPSRKPALTIIVVIDSPHGRGYYGGTVSAPVFHRIAEAALRHLAVPPTINPLAPVLVTRHDGGAAEPSAHPASGPSQPERVAVPLQPGLMPDLHGVSAREAVRLLMRIGLTPRISGDGVVVEQSPAAGVPLAPGESCTLTLGRRQAVTAGGARP
jgi:cell division protein FtsI (penicillin-binding protein 3)